MKKILLAISSLFLVAGCNNYTVKVDVSDVTINGEAVEQGACKEYDDSFFGLVGDFPLKIQIGEGEESEHDAGHYVVNAEGVKSTEEACVVEDVAEEAGEGEATAEDAEPAEEAGEGEATAEDAEPAEEAGN